MSKEAYWIIEQFGRKRGQKKRKDVDNKLLYIRYFVVNEQSAVKNSFNAYVRTYYTME